MVDKALLDNPAVYPPEETKKKLFSLAVLPPDVDRLFTRIWTDAQDRPVSRRRRGAGTCPPRFHSGSRT